MVAQAFNPNTQEAGTLWVWGLPGLYSKFQASQGYAYNETLSQTKQIHLQKVCLNSAGSLVWHSQNNRTTKQKQNNRINKELVKVCIFPQIVFPQMSKPSFPVTGTSGSWPLLSSAVSAPCFSSGKHSGCFKARLCTMTPLLSRKALLLGTQTATLRKCRPYVQARKLTGWGNGGPSLSPGKLTAPANPPLPLRNRLRSHREPWQLKLRGQPCPLCQA